jgi:hypothetical protein
MLKCPGPSNDAAFASSPAKKCFATRARIVGAGAANSSCGSQRDDEPIAADAADEAGYLVGVLSVGDVRIDQPTCAIAC